MNINSSSTSRLRSSEEVMPEVPAPPSTPEPTGNSDFAAVLRQFLPLADGAEVNEEQLFAGLIFERLSSQVSPEAAQEYQAAVNTTVGQFRRSDGYVDIETNARQALASLVSTGTLSEEQADKIHSEAFQAAQLDGNADALYDSVGSGSDQTRAVATLEAALLSSRVTLEQFDSGELTATTRPVNTTLSNSIAPLTAMPPGTVGSISTQPLPQDDIEIASSGTLIDGAEGFLFKPISDNQGRLAILLPTELTGQVLDVILRDEKGEEIERGKLMADGIAETGREKYDFSRKGGEYSSNLMVEVLLANGATMRYKIPDPGKRYD